VEEQEQRMGNEREIQRIKLQRTRMNPERDGRQRRDNRWGVRLCGGRGCRCDCQLHPPGQVHEGELALAHHVIAQGVGRGMAPRGLVLVLAVGDDDDDDDDNHDDDDDNDGDDVP
jgi:hypothetical protein